MPNYLDESDWKAVLDKPKNLPLKAQKTGVSEKLRAYKVANGAWVKNPGDEKAADKLVKALIDLKRTLDKEIKAHKRTFSTATDYLTEVRKAANERLQAVGDYKAFKENAAVQRQVMAGIHI